MALGQLAAAKWQLFVAVGQRLQDTQQGWAVGRGCNSGRWGPLPRPDGRCQETDSTFTKGAVDGQFSNAGEACVSRAVPVGWG